MTTRPNKAPRLRIPPHYALTDADRQRIEKISLGEGRKARGCSSALHLGIDAQIEPDLGGIEGYFLEDDETVRAFLKRLYQMRLESTGVFVGLNQWLYLCLAPGKGDAQKLIFTAVTEHDDEGISNYPCRALVMLCCGDRYWMDCENAQGERARYALESGAVIGFNEDKLHQVVKDDASVYVEGQFYEADRMICASQINLAITCPDPGVDQFPDLLEVSS